MPQWSRRHCFIVRADSRTSTATASGLSPELSARVSRRFAGAALVYSIGYTVGFGTGILQAPELTTRFHIIIACASIGFALLTAIIVRHRLFSPSTIERLAVPFCIAGGLGLTAGGWGWESQNAIVYRHLADLPESVQQFFFGCHPDWIAVWIIVFPLLVPLSFRRMLVAALVTGSLALAVPLLSLAVHGTPDPVRPFLTDVILAVGIPTFICVGVAILGSRIIHGYARDLTRAKRLGSYQLLKVLGRGGMGEVWTARHGMLARPAAIKLIRPDSLMQASRASPEEVTRLMKRFEREAQATAALTSEHTIRVYDFGITDDGTFYYVMELLRGLDLRTLINRFGPIQPERVIHLLKQACHSLAEAHATGLIHRDIKPANIFTCHRGLDFDFTKILDFGLVKDVSDRREEQTQLTAEGITSGTPAFLAPEMAWGDRPIDGRTDLYSLGCVAWWLLTGRLVFEGENAMKILLQHVSEEPKPPSACTELQVPKALDDLILACLEKDPDKRPASAQVLASKLIQAERDRPSWTPECAEEWWRTNLPQIVALPAGIMSEEEEESISYPSM